MVLLALSACTTPSCTTPSRDNPPPDNPPPRAVGSAPLVQPDPPRAAVRGAPSASAAPPDPATRESALPQSPSGSAYFGCGVPIPVERLWDETSEGQVLEAISAAKQCAAEHHRRLLLEFVAPWCKDCREMARLEETETVSRTLQTRYERVRINVGKWDRHEALRMNHQVRALATYIVIDPKTSRELAKTTLEPVTKKGKQITAEEWAKWLSRY